jgi:hypothetical protein
MLTCGFASHRASCTVAQRSNSTITAAQDGMAWALWVGDGVGTVDRERSRLHPSSRTEPEHPAVLGRFRVERRAAGSRSSVMAGECAGRQLKETWRCSAASMCKTQEEPAEPSSLTCVRCPPGPSAAGLPHQRAAVLQPRRSAVPGARHRAAGGGAGPAVAGQGVGKRRTVGEGTGYEVSAGRLRPRAAGLVPRRLDFPHGDGSVRRFAWRSLEDC